MEQFKEMYEEKYTEKKNHSPKEISRQELRIKLIHEIIEENRPAFEKLSRT